MKSTDKFLIAIVIGVILLVVITFGLALTRPQPTYLTDNTPEAVTHNYLLALQKGDHERAYGYLAPSVPGYPKDLAKFKRDINTYGYSLNDIADSTFDIGSASIVDQQTTVNVRDTQFQPGGFLSNGQQYTNNFTVTLEQDRQTQGWKIVSSTSYWLWCWEESEGCQ